LLLLVVAAVIVAFNLKIIRRLERTVEVLSGLKLLVNHRNWIIVAVPLDFFPLFSNSEKRLALSALHLQPTFLRSSLWSLEEKSFLGFSCPGEDSTEQACRIGADGDNSSASFASGQDDR